MPENAKCPKCGAALKVEGDREMVFACDTVANAPMYTSMVISQSRRCVERELVAAKARIAELDSMLRDTYGTIIMVQCPSLLKRIKAGLAKEAPDA